MNNKPKRMTVAVVATLFAALSLFTACSGGGGGLGGGSSSLTLSEAFCNDLEAGYSTFQILGSDVSNGTYTAQEAADLSYGWAAIDCPEQLVSNFGLREYLGDFGINPDL